MYTVISNDREPPMENPAYMDISQLEKTFATPQGPLTIVRDFNLKVRQGEFVALLGHSGCGKSTVLSMLAGLAAPTAGVIVLANKEVDGPGPTAAWFSNRPVCCRG